MAHAHIRPFLMFQGNAEEALTFYVALFPHGRVLDLVRHGPGEAGAEGTVWRAIFEIGGQEVICIDSATKHDFTFTPAFSFFVQTDSEEEIDRLWAALSEGGVEHMPLGDYGFSRRFGWLSDRFGVSWQLSLT